jgi:hypothetical protein
LAAGVFMAKNARIQKKQQPHFKLINIYQEFGKCLICHSCHHLLLSQSLCSLCVLLFYPLPPPMEWEEQRARHYQEATPLPAFALTKQPVPSVVLKVFVFLSLQDAALVEP